ncbi:MAG: hypothetical protein E7437_06345 [Ruminococcaceae bacterium]|nr:hypothetical protein [Oscillospiraceae bacterium]
MKRWILALLAVCMAVGLVVLASPEVKAADHAHHCYCGGNGGADHVCETSATWTAVNSGTAIAVEDGGHYYLEKDMAASITVKNGETVTLCLNGKTLRAQCPVLVYNGVLNICDCQGGGVIKTTKPQNAKGTVMLISSTTTSVGTVNLYAGTVDGSANDGLFCRTAEVKGGVFNLYGGTLQKGMSDGSVATDTHPGFGGNVLVYNNEQKVGTFTMYGGTVTGGTVTGDGGNVYAEKSARVCILGGVLEKGTANYGGNLYYVGAVTMKNATLREGTALTARGNLFVAKGVDLLSNTITQGVAGGKPENIRILRNGTTLSTDHTSLAEAIEKMKKDSNPEHLRLQLLADHEEAYTVSEDVTLDLNGHSLSEIAVSATLKGLDSTTDTYTGQTRGSLSYTLRGGQVLGLSEGGSHYIMVPGEEQVSFHRYHMQVTHISVAPADVAMGYKTQVSGDDAALSQVDRVGYELWLEGNTPLTYSKYFTQDDRLVTLRLKNILSTKLSNEKNLEYAQTKVNARPFAILRDGTKVTFPEVAYTFKEALHGADRFYSTYTAGQKSGLKNLGATFSMVMTGWDVENFHHASTGRWTKVNNTGFQTYLNKYNTAGNWKGSYYLTGDLDLGDTTIRITPGHSLTICLNGHTIRGNRQIFTSSGNLTICDCHETGDEGSVKSSYSTTSNEYAPVAHIWTGTAYLYGGNLTAGGSMRSAGVVAVGNPYSENGTASLYMYGGSISGGYARYNGGLLNVWHGSVFTMYGGALHDGYCEADGGGLVVRDGSTVNLYGGEIYNCTAQGNGGGIHASIGANCHIGAVKLYQNTANNGGNIYAANTAITLDGAVITGGEAQMGGGVYLSSGDMTLSGATRIKENTAHSMGQDLHLSYTATVCADGLSQGADVRISAARHGKVGTKDSVADYLHCNTEGFRVMRKGADMVLWKGNLTTGQTPTGFSAGYGAVCINPRELGVPLAGYGDTLSRRSKSVDGDLYVTATAITDESGETVLMLAVDMSTMTEAQLDPILDHVSYYTGVPRSHIISATSHTHSAPSLTASDPTITRYRQLLPDWFAQAAIQAMNDRQPAVMYTGSFEVGGGKDGYGLNFTRHYQFLRDGVWEYSCDNFGERNLNSQKQVRHVTDADQTMHLVKFDRSGTDILMVNWRAHPTLTGGPDKFVLSSDYVGALREAVKADTGMDVIFFQGAAGNVNAVSRLTKEQHGLDFRGLAQSLSDQIRTAVKNGCLSRKTPGLWQVDNYEYMAVVDRSDNSRYEEAKAFVAEYYDTFPGNQAPQQERLDWCKARGWTCVFEASGIIRRHDKAEDTETMPLNTLALGKHLAFYTAPGELWDTVSQEVENTGYFDTVFCVGYSMESYSYFVYDPTNGGAMQYASYEGFNRIFRAPDTINAMLSYWKTTLQAMAEKAK